jgi:hypothetical protein
MKRYMLFIVPEYYPRGGIEDLAAVSDDLNELLEQTRALTSQYVSWHIFDTHKGEVVAETALSPELLNKVESVAKG